MLSLFPLEQGKNVLFQFPAGKCVFTQLPNGKYQVSPDMRRGMIQFIYGRGNTIHVKWINLSNGKVEDDHMVVPIHTEWKFKKVNTGRENDSKDRVYILQFTINRTNLMFWMQDPDSSKDQEMVHKVITILANRKARDFFNLAAALANNPYDNTREVMYSSHPNSNAPTHNVGHRTAPLPLSTNVLAQATLNSNNNATGPTAPPPVPPSERVRRTRPSPQSATPAVVATTANAVSTSNQTNSTTTGLAPAAATVSGNNNNNATRPAAPPAVGPSERVRTTRLNNQANSTTTGLAPAAATVSGNNNNNNATRPAAPPPGPPPEPVRSTRPSSLSTTPVVVAPAVNGTVSVVSLTTGNMANLGRNSPEKLGKFAYPEQLKKLTLWGVRRAFAESCLLDTQGDLLQALKMFHETLKVSIQRKEITSGSITHQWFSRVSVAIRSWLPNFKENGDKDNYTVYVMHVALKWPFSKSPSPHVEHQNRMFAWKLPFRYNRFRSLYSSVSPLVHRLLSHHIPDIPYPGFHSGTSFVYSHLPKFPLATVSDWMFGPTDEQRNDRMLKLGSWMEALVCHPLLMTQEEIRHRVWEFLEVDKHVTGMRWFA